MKPWEYQPSPSLNKSISERLTVFPRERDMTHSLLRGFWNISLRIFLKLYFRLEIHGRANLPQKGSYVLVANHSSHLDAVCLSSAIPMKKMDHVFAVAASDYFFSSFWKSFISAVFINALPFDRQNEKRKSLELCADVLTISQRALIMFPEGTRSMTGEIDKFKKGIGILVAGTERKVAPAYIDGAHQAWPKGLKFPRPKKIRVIIGQALDFRDVKGTEEGYSEVASTVEAEVRNLKEGSHGES